VSEINRPLPQAVLTRWQGQPA